MTVDVVKTTEKIRCDACPVMCYIADGRVGACDRYANHAGELVRLDPLTILESSQGAQIKTVPFLNQDNRDNLGRDDESQDNKESDNWDGNIVSKAPVFVTAIGAGTTYPDYKPAPFIVSQKIDDVDMVTVVTEGIFSYCGVKIKIDTDRFIGHERAIIRAGGEPVGHVMTSEYGSKMLSLGGVEHLTGGSKKEGRLTCDALLRLCNCEAVELTIDDGAVVIVQAGKAPIIDGDEEKLMRVGCGSATIGMFAAQWTDHADEVIVVDDHITGVLSEHQAGKMLDVPPTGIKIKGRRSTPGRYFQVAEPGTGWGGTNISDPLSILKSIDEKVAWAGLRLLMISTTGEQYAYYVLNEDLVPIPTDISKPLLLSAERIAENCEPSICSVLFMGGAGGSLRAGVTENPVKLTHSVKKALTEVTCGGAQSYIWPGGGITLMADVTQMPSNAFGYVPTPAIVAPIEFTMRLSDYQALGGHMDEVQSLESLSENELRKLAPVDVHSDPNARSNFSWHVSDTDVVDKGGL